jgi:hypothetical protein
VEDLNALVAARRKLHAIYADPPWAFEVYSGKASNGQPNARLSLVRYYISECGLVLGREMAWVPPSGSPPQPPIEGGLLALRMPDRVPARLYLSLH